VADSENAWLDTVVPNPYSDGSSKRPHGLIFLEKCSLPMLYRLNRHFFLKGKRSRHKILKTNYYDFTEKILSYIRLEEIKLGISDYPVAQKYQKTIDMILQYLEKEYDALHHEWEVASVIAQLYKDKMAKLSDRKLDGVDIDDWIALGTLQLIPKKNVPEKIIREILKDFELPEEKVEKSRTGYDLK